MNIILYLVRSYMRAQRRLKDNLVIVCEGTETEYLYFSDVAKIVQAEQPERFGTIKVVPTPKEYKEMELARRTYKRRMRPDVSGISHPEWLYYVKEDHSQNEYDNFKAYPTRFVREAQLFLEDGEYTEAWAIYDKDVHPRHKQAVELANMDERLHIAYSAYSFEEWILCHFERNSHSYRRSICENGICGINNARCMGHDCLIGRIRQKGYIRDLKKNSKDIYDKYLCVRFKQALINVAWLRFIGRCHEKELGLELYQRNPYTTIDTFMTNLMGVSEQFEWHSLNDYFVFEKDLFLVKIEINDLIICLKGNGTHPLNDKRLFYCDSGGNRTSPLLLSSVCLHEKQKEIRMKLIKSERYIRLEEPKSIKYKVVIIELPLFG